MENASYVRSELIQNGKSGNAELHRRRVFVGPRAGELVESYIYFADLYSSIPVDLALKDFFDPTFLPELGEKRQVYVQGVDASYYINSDGSCYHMTGNERRIFTQDAGEVPVFVGMVDIASCVVPFHREGIFSIVERDWSGDLETRLRGGVLRTRELPLGVVEAIRVSAEKV